RLAFAVAAHVEPEVLLVDEVLAVGDIQFQKKCLGKMQDASRNDGRTVLFVSHNMAAVQQMCGTAILLRNGRVHRNGPTASVIAEYARSVKEVQETGLAMRVDRHGNGNLKFTSVSFHDCIGAETQTILSGMSLRIRLHYDSEYNGAAHYVDVAVKLTNESGLALTTFANIQTGQTQMRLHRRGYLEVEWPKVNLRSGEYDCVIYVAVDGDVCDWLKNAFAFRIEDGDFYGTGAMISRDHGDVLCDHAWRSVPVAAGLPVAMRQQETAGKCAPKDLGDGDPSLTP
ncbi:MAG: ABC transporter ATP-binding protein, partial [Planctomycetes bacterium]|nr:ABC transporter ATP-binding protein [Planctomycetota bacterium]